MSKSFAKTGLLPGLFLMAFLFSACSNNETVVGNEQIVGSGRIVSQVRPVGTLAGIRVTNFAKVFITQDTVESLRIESDDNIMDRVVTSVSNGVLTVGMKNGSYNHVTVNVYVSMRDVHLIESTGAAEFRSTAPIHTETIVCRITGAGTVRLSGTATYQSVEISGAGSVHNFDLVSTRCSASIAGSGNIEVNVTQQLDATIAGVGSITYAGNPPVVHQSISGIGSIQPRE